MVGRPFLGAMSMLVSGSVRLVVYFWGHQSVPEFPPIQIQIGRLPADT